MSRCTKPHNNSLDRDWYILYLINCTTYFSPLFRERHHLPWPLPGTSDWSTAYHRLQDVLQGTVPISRPPSIIQSVLVYPMRPPLYRHVSMHAQWYWGLLFCKYQFILFPLLTHTHTHTHSPLLPLMAVRNHTSSMCLWVSSAMWRKLDAREIKKRMPMVLKYSARW